MLFKYTRYTVLNLLKVPDNSKGLIVFQRHACILHRAEPRGFKNSEIRFLTSTIVDSTQVSGTIE